MDEDWLLHKQNSKEEEEVIDKLEQVVRKWSSGTEEKDFFRSGEILQDDEEEVYFHFESSTKQEEIEEMKEQTNNKNGEERLPIREVRSIFAEDEDGLANQQNETTSNNTAVGELNNKENPPQLINAKLKPHLELTSSLSANSRRLPISVICERKRQSFYILAAFHKVSLEKIMLALSILPRIHLFLLRRQREIEGRTKFVRAFLDSILQDFVEISSTQHKFACMTVDNFNVGEGVVVPLFEQGLQEMLKNTKRLQLKILEQRSLVHSRLVEKLRRVDHMHSQAEIHLGNCDNRVKELVEFLARLRELFSKVQDMYEKTMSEDQASHVGNGDLEARGDVYRQAFKYGSCLRTIISETKRSVHMAFDLRDALIEKEIDTLRIVASVFKELKVFAQESMGPIAASSIEGAEPHFNKLGDPITTQRKYQLSRIFNDEECKLFHIDRKTIDEDVHVSSTLSRNLKKHYFLGSSAQILKYTFNNTRWRQL
jgi:Mg2+ and Co2+ transporter CorA